MQYAVDESHEQRQAFLEVDALLDHLFRHVRRFVTSNPLPSYIRSVVVAFRCGAYDGKSNSAGYGNLGATVATILLLPKPKFSGVNSNTVTPPVSTWWSNFEIEAVSPLVLLENFPNRFRGSLRLHFVDNAAALSILVNGSSSVIQGDILIGATWSQIQRLLVFPWFDRMENCSRAFPVTAGWTLEGRILGFPGVSPSRSAARARRERRLLGQHVVGAAHP